MCYNSINLNKSVDDTLPHLDINQIFTKKLKFHERNEFGTDKHEVKFLDRNGYSTQMKKRGPCIQDHCNHGQEVELTHWLKK